MLCCHCHKCSENGGQHSRMQEKLSIIVFCMIWRAMFKRLALVAEMKNLVRQCYITAISS